MIGAEHIGRSAKTLLAGTNSHGTTEIATGATVVIANVFLPLSHLDGPERAQVVVYSPGDVVCTMEARHLQLLTDTVGPSSRGEESKPEIHSYDRDTIEYLTAAGVSRGLVDRVEIMANEIAYKKLALAKAVQTPQPAVDREALFNVMDAALPVHVHADDRDRAIDAVLALLNGSGH